MPHGSYGPAVLTLTMYLLDCLFFFVVNKLTVHKSCHIPADQTVNLTANITCSDITGIAR